MNNINKKRATTTLSILEWAIRQHMRDEGEKGLKVSYAEHRDLINFFNKIAVDKRALRGGEKCYRGKKLDEYGLRR